MTDMGDFYTVEGIVKALSLKWSTDKKSLRTISKVTMNMDTFDQFRAEATVKSKRLAIGYIITFTCVWFCYFKYLWVQCFMAVKFNWCDIIKPSAGNRHDHFR